MRDDALRRGDLVEVKSPAEILATLDDRGTLGGLPFMPEMIAYCGRRFVVDKRADKICDTINWTGSRRLPDTVLLEQLRCDGSGHDGCQAECRLFWKEAWLRRVRPDEAVAPPPAGDLSAVTERTTSNSSYTAVIDSRQVRRYRCQATELFGATYHVKTWDPRAYVREYATGNVKFQTFLRVLGRALWYQPLRKLGIRPRIVLPGTAAPGTQAKSTAGLQPGEYVTVRSREEIAATLTPEGKNRGLWFDGDEMLPFCGGTFRVRQRLNHFIDDRTGEMITLKSDCLTLDGVVCSGERSLGRWFCAREIYPYWREVWLRRAGDPPTPVAAGAGSLAAAERQKHHPGSGQIHEGAESRVDEELADRKPTA